MPTIGSTSKPAYVYDAGTDTWIPIGPGEHTHDYIGKDVITTTGDIIYASAANTPARRGIGSTGQVLTVSGGLPVWSTPASGGKVLQVIQATHSTEIDNSTTTYTDSGLSVSITPTLSSSKILIAVSIPCRKSSANINNAVNLKLVRNSTDIFESRANFFTGTALRMQGMVSFNYLDSPSTTSSITYKIQFRNEDNTATATVFNSGFTGSIIVSEIGA